MTYAEDDRLEVLSDVIKKLQRDISDAEWEGLDIKAERLSFELEGLLALQDQGELYLPRF